MPSSMNSPRASRKRHSVATRGTGSRPSRRFATAGTPGPDSRTMPMAPRPPGVASATMVSVFSSPLRMGRFVAREHALDLPLLKDRKDVVDEPVEHQPGREKEEENAEDER